MTWQFTHNPKDPCSLCVQWRCELCKQPICPESCPAWPGGMGTEYEPYWPDGSTVPRIYRNLHRRCADAMYEYSREAAGDPT